MLEGTLSFLSQAGESENLFGQYICLEVTGLAKVESSLDGEMVIVPIRVNKNLQSATPEELGRRRKTLHLATLMNLRDELSRELDANTKIVGNSGVKRINDEFDRMMNMHESVVYEQFYVDSIYKKLATEAIETKSMAMLKIEIYVESVKANCDDAVQVRGRRDQRLHARSALEIQPRRAVHEKPSCI